MTRDERLKAGWSLSGWAIRGKVNGGQTVWATWPRDGLSNPPIAARSADRQLFAIRRGALAIAAQWQDIWEAKLVQVWRRKKAPPPLAVGGICGNFEVKQCDVVGRWTVCGRCEDKLANLFVRKDLTHKGKVVGDVGILFNVDEKCRLIRMSIIDRWNGVDR